MGVACENRVETHSYAVQIVSVHHRAQEELDAGKVSLKQAFQIEVWQSSGRIATT